MSNYVTMFARGRVLKMATDFAGNPSLGNPLAADVEAENQPLRSPDDNVCARPTRAKPGYRRAKLLNLERLWQRGLVAFFVLPH